MAEYNDKYIEEINYLESIIDLLKYKIETESEKLSGQKTDLIAARKEMWENTTHSATDYDKLSDLNQYLSALNSQTFSYTELEKQISKYKKMIDNPYFSRIDFTEEGYDDTEKIYIGLFNLMDENSHEIKVYDWRAPICSIYYRSEIGPVEYKAPSGTIKGTLSLKRQYKINKGKLEYFFDSNVNIVDEMLMEALSQNMTSSMKLIVETIQKQQDLIIRDVDNDLLVVQGAAGSGKSSVALHRIAFLLYQGLDLKLSANNVVIISPNNLFSKYISNVLPELGENNIQEYTFENIFLKLFNNKLSIKTKSENFENIICSETEEKRTFLQLNDEFKGSKVFLQIIDRFIDYFERKLVPFEDVYFNGKTIEKRELLKSFLISKNSHMATAKKLKIIESRIMDKVRDMKNERREKIEEVVTKSGRHEFETKAFTRVMAAKETSRFLKKIQRFTEFDSYELYKKLFQDKNLFLKLSKGLTLPDKINEIIDYTNKNINDPYNIPYSDGIAMMYLKAKAEGDTFSNIKQVVVDEAQDYSPMHYYLLKNLFKEARFTIVGDINQAVEKKSDMSFYDDIISIFNFKKSNKIIMNKSYRSSYEISKFCERFLEEKGNTEYFKRNEEEPEIIKTKNNDDLENKIIKQINNYKANGYNSVAIICKNRKQAADLYFSLKEKINDIKLVDYLGEQSLTGTIILPVYLAKGLEFDAVIVYSTDNKNYNTIFDKKLLYVACTRALHRLSLIYTGKASKFLK